MAIDGRLASATCNLGPLIEADAAASDALQGTGVIRWKGSVKIKGLITPTAGATVTISDIPKRFRVMSSFADPMANTTTVEIGCTLSFLSNRKPKIENPTAAEENNTVPCEATRAGAFPNISAQYVFDQCVSALGISSSGAILTNTFAIKEFDLSGGYISAISDLLSSECQVGEMDQSDVLQVRSLNSVSGGGPRFSEADLISISPVGSGNLPGDAVAVRYSTRRLKPPEPAADPEDPADEEKAKDEDKRAWEYSKSELIGQEIQLKAGVDEFGSAAEISYTNYQISETVTEYDALDRVIKRTTTARQPLGQANGTFAQSAFLPSTRTIGPSPTETVPDEWTKIVRNMVSLPVETIDVEIIKYEFDAPPAEDEPGDTILDCQERQDAILPKDSDVDISKIKSQETYRYESECAILGSLGYSSYLADYSRWRTNGGTTRHPADIGLTADLLTQKTETTYENTAVNINLSQYGVAPTTQLPGAKTSTENTRSTVTKYLAYAFTQQGQQMGARRLIEQLFQFSDTITTDVLPAALELIKVETSQESVIGREYGLQTRPSAADRSNENNAKSSTDPDTVESGSEPSIESVEQIEFVSGASSSQNVVEFTLPLAPDDRMSWNGTAWTSTPSDAAVKARNYGRVQNRLLLGNRVGMEIQVLPDRVPDMAGDGIAISMGGLTAQYLINNLSYVINADGMVASVNACFWGALGATPEFDLVDAWVPTAPGLSALPTPPTTTGGTTITTPTGGTVVSGGTVGTGPIYPPYNEVVFLTGVVRIQSSTLRRAYALTLPSRTSVASIVIQSSVTRLSLPVVPREVTTSVVIEAPTARLYPLIVRLSQAEVLLQQSTGWTLGRPSAAVVKVQQYTAPAFVEWDLVNRGSVNTVTTTAPNPSLPASTQEGDLLVCVVAARGSQTFTPPTGWTLAVSEGSGNSDSVSTGIASGALAYIVRGASAPATQWTLTTADVAQSRIFAYRPSAGSVEFVAASSSTQPSNTLTPTTAGLTTVGTSCLVIAAGCGATNVDWSAFDAATDPSTASSINEVGATTEPSIGAWTLRNNQATTTGSNVSMGTADAIKQFPGATGTIEATVTQSSRHVMLAAAFRAV